MSKSPDFGFTIGFSIGPVNPVGPVAPVKHTRSLGPVGSLGSLGPVGPVIGNCSVSIYNVFVCFYMV